MPIMTPEDMGIRIKWEHSYGAYVAIHDLYPAMGTGRTEHEALCGLLDQIADWIRSEAPALHPRPRATWRNRLKRLLWKYSGRFRRTSIHSLRNAAFQRKAITAGPQEGMPFDESL